MSLRYPGGLITKSPTAPTTSAAAGIWTLDQALQYIKAGTWPFASFTVIQTFTSSTTWICPPGVTSVEALVVAGGGPGGGDQGGGGGAGGLSYISSFAVTAGTSYTVTVGAGGTGTTGRSVVAQAAHSLQTELVTLVDQVVAVEQAQVEPQTKEVPVVQLDMEMLVQHIAQDQT
jgi:hypothetical protein